MIPSLTGTIKPGEYKEIIDNSSKSVDRIPNCWVGKQRTDEDVRSNTRIISGSRNIYIPGEDRAFTDRILTQIENAQNLIVLSSYLLQKGVVTDALLEKVQAGVSVYILTARSEDLRNSTDDELSENKVRMIQDHKNLLDNFADTILVRTADYFHAKFIVCDPLSANPWGMLMTCNMTVDALNGTNLELGVELTQNEIQSLFALFLQGFWKEAQYELFQKGKLSPTHYDVSIIKGLNFGDIAIPATYKNHHSLKEAILSVINAAKETIDVGSWTLNNKEILKLLQDKAKAGIQVNIYVHISELNSIVLDEVCSSGVSIYGHSRLHAKFIFADRKEGIVMTANISNHGIDDGYDVGLSLADAKLVSGIINAISSECTHRYMKQPRLSEFTPGVQSIRYLKGGLDRVVKINCNASVEHQINVKSVIDMLNPTLPDMSVKHISPNEIEVAKESEYIFTFDPEILPSEEQLTPEESTIQNVKLFASKDNKDKKYVCIQNWEDIPSIIDLTKKGYTAVIDEQSDTWGALPATTKGLVESILGSHRKEHENEEKK